MNEWQPIETAPKDGTKILVFCNHGEFEVSEWYKLMNTRYEPVEGSNLFSAVEEVYATGWNGNSFSHWMPLPEPPELAA